MIDIKVSLRIYSEVYSLTEVSEKLGCSEDFGYSKGDILSENSNSVYSETLWGKAKHSISFDKLNVYLDELVTWVNSRKVPFFELIHNSSIRSDLFIGFFSDNGQGGTEISAENMKRISEFGLDLVFDVQISDE